MGVTHFLVKNVIAMRMALEHHNGTCAIPVRAFLLNPVDRTLLPWHELWGIPLLPDERVPVKRIRLDCGGSAWRIEEEIALYVDEETG